MKVITKDRGLVIVPELHLYTIIWLHGLGDSGFGFQDLFLSNPVLPNCKVVLPTAPYRPVTINSGRGFNSWYDFVTIDDEYHESAEERVEIILKIIEEERPLTNTLILGGLSQGGAMALYVGLSKYTGKLDGIIALSTYSFPMQVPQDRKNIPVLWCHGAIDELLLLSRAETTISKYLQGVNLTFKVFPYLSHNIDLEEWAFVREWLHSLFVSRPNLDL